MNLPVLCPFRIGSVRFLPVGAARILPGRHLPASAAVVAFLAASSARATEEIAFFEAKVRPVLVAHCYECHSEEAGERKGGLWLDRRLGWMEGGDAGPAILPGDVEGSLLVHSVRYIDPEIQMPPRTRLSDEEVAILEEWIARGAHDPRDESMAAALREEAIDFEAARQEWAYRPLASPEIPEVADVSWPAGPAPEIDRFVLASLEAEGLSPAAPGDPAALLRRLHHDLTGLPPRREEVAAFVADPSEEAYAAVVDDLLSRTAYGERWGRHWLDVARYADSNGADRNYTYYQAWRYRNWVIEAFNRDLPYYDFVRAQVAGDLDESGSLEERADGMVASTFLTMGPKMLTERDKEKLWLDTADEQLDTLGRAFLGLTLGCARCHDHKFDPVSQEDYYALAGIFRSTEVVHGTRNGCVNVASWIERPLPVEGPGGEAAAAMVERLELAMRLTVEQSFKKKAGGAMAEGLPFAGVIYDKAQAELHGEWKDSNHSPKRIGETYAHSDRQGSAEKRAVFFGSLPESGVYELRLSYNAGANRSARVPVSVTGKDGTHRLELDQTRPPSVAGLFEPIGRFAFEKGAECEVVIGTEGTDGAYVIVDAVQFVAVGDLGREADALAAAEEEDAELDPIYLMSEAELKKELNRLIDELKEAEVAMAPREAADADDVHLRVRGETGLLGPKIPRNFLTVLHDGPAPEIAPGESGRRQLAEWLAGEDNALLDRVMVNRVWHHLFGVGLVESVDNFGRLGSGPSHPELLEFLALRFREGGGSVKSLVRELALSRAYRVGARPHDSLLEGDPTNRLFGWRHPRRLSAEELRDSVLFHSGELDFSPGLATATPIGIDLDKAHSFAEERKRTVYLPVARNNLATELAVFDGANPEMVTGARPNTTVPTQALYLLNSDFLHEQAGVLAKRAAASGGGGGEAEGEAASEASAVRWLYETLYARAPEPRESERALAFLEGAELADFAHLLLASSEFLFLE